MSENGNPHGPCMIRMRHCLAAVAAVAAWSPSPRGDG